MEELLGVFHFQALVVGRVCDDDAGLCHGGGLPGGEVPALDADHVLQAGGAYVAAGCLHGLGVDVGADDGVGGVALLAVVVVEALEELAVEVGPLLESVAGAEDARVDVRGYECGFDEEGAGAAHGVEERGVSAPAGLEDDAGGEDLVEGCLCGLDAVAALAERLAG